ncbi:hypothetical protein BC939DRAFT_530929 [Gamsiella multidivaricata]|uniref:uncharacterized protein n=1 Tax=Gamsiella multidivaricata TaxID=101098 RepID=UPI002220C06D|nr:uncharacterized protein BC939DRAFT_530929 [Gamsiella multidivaricata]KAI7819926.1 hypothetical protein BC939DRAFT_530929 [Gamsiella multidivaricata]
MSGGIPRCIDAGKHQLLTRIGQYRLTDFHAISSCPGHPRPSSESSVPSKRSAAEVVFEIGEEADEADMSAPSPKPPQKKVTFLEVEFPSECGSDHLLMDARRSMIKKQSEITDVLDLLQVVAGESSPKSRNPYSFITLNFNSILSSTYEKKKQSNIRARAHPLPCVGMKATQVANFVRSSTHQSTSATPKFAFVAQGGFISYKGELPELGENIRKLFAEEYVTVLEQIKRLGDEMTSGLERAKRAV